MEYNLQQGLQSSQQISYTLDLRFHLRYLVVIFVISQYLEEVQSYWQAAFDPNMDKANMITQTLSRAAVDRSTTCRFSYDKCFDISNTKIPSLTCPFPSIFMRMSQSLANSLSTHRPPPLQVALGRFNRGSTFTRSSSTTSTNANPKISAPIDQEKADQYQQHSTPMTPPSTCHHPTTTPAKVHHGRDLLQSVCHADAYLVL